ncbi:MAG: hypothetical protein KAX80_06000 [Planctomycetes bacterium]|nr:hypothetical protein [Planctomycetota bacterium]
MAKASDTKGDPSGQPQGDKTPQQGIAHIPATVLTVEYVDDSEGMDAALKAMNTHLRQLEQKITAMQETQARMVAAITQQAKDLTKAIDSMSRRIEGFYTRMGGGESAQESQSPQSREEPE